MAVSFLLALSGLGGGGHCSRWAHREGQHCPMLELMGRVPSSLAFLKTT